MGISFSPSLILWVGLRLPELCSPFWWWILKISQESKGRENCEANLSPPGYISAFYLPLYPSPFEFHCGTIVQWYHIPVIRSWQRCWYYNIYYTFFCLRLRDTIFPSCVTSFRWWILKFSQERERREDCEGDSGPRNASSIFPRFHTHSICMSISFCVSLW